MDATDFSFNNFQALSRPQSCFSGPPFYTNDLMRNLDQGDPIIDVDSVLSGFVHGWPEAELKRSQYIGLGAWCEQRNLPTFILYVPRNAKTRSRKDVRVHSDVILCSALGKIAPVNFSVPEFHADFLSRTQPIVHPDRFALCRASDPSPNQSTIIVVSAIVLTVVINAGTTEHNGVRVSALESQV